VCWRGRYCGSLVIAHTVRSCYVQAAFSGVKLFDEKMRSAAALKKLAGTIVAIYDGVRSRFSVDEQRHYLFTPRDLTSFVVSLLRYRVDSEPLLDIVTYEAQRHFRDRLVNSDAETRFDSLLVAALRKDWEYRVAVEPQFFSAVSRSGGGGRGGADGKESDAQGDARGATMERLAQRDFLEVVSRAKMLYEREERELHMCLFPEILDHIVRVERVLSKPCGSLLLVGRSGVGRRTATMLVAYMQRMQFSSPYIMKGYSLKNFFVDLKAVLQAAGVEGEQVGSLVVVRSLVLCFTVLGCDGGVCAGRVVPGRLPARGPIHLGVCE
jgi:dynein heavy chain 2